MAGRNGPRRGMDPEEYTIGAWRNRVSGIVTQAERDREQRQQLRIDQIGDEDRIQSGQREQRFKPFIILSEDKYALVIRRDDATTLLQFAANEFGVAVTGEPAPNAINLGNQASIYLWSDEFLTSVLSLSGVDGSIDTDGNLTVGGTAAITGALTVGGDADVLGSLNVAEIVRGAGNDQRWRSGAHADPNGATLSVVGSTAWTSPATVTNSNTTASPFLNYATGAVSGNASGPNGPAIYRGDWGADCTFRVRLSDLTSIRLWVGLFASDPSAAGNPAVERAAFRFDTVAGDTTWQCHTRDATTTGVTNSGVTVVGGVVNLRIVLTSTTALFYIDDVLVATRTTNLPVSTTLLAPYARVTTLGNFVRNFQFGTFNALSR